MNPTTRISTARQVGYVIAIIFLIAFLIVLNNFQKWNLPFVSSLLTQDFKNWLPAANLSISVAIFSNFLFLLYDPAWFRHLMQAVQNAFSLFSTWKFYQLFPVSLPSAVFETSLHWVLIVLMLLTALGMLVDLVRAVTSYTRAQA